MRFGKAVTVMSLAAATQSMHVYLLVDGNAVTDLHVLEAVKQFSLKADILRSM
jgi:hypothetical protein